MPTIHTETIERGSILPVMRNAQGEPLFTPQEAAAFWRKIFSRAFELEQFAFKDGPLAPTIDTALSSTSEKLQDINEALLPIHLVPSAYSTPAIERETASLIGYPNASGKHTALEEIAAEHRENLAHIGRDFAATITEPEIPLGILEVPPFMGKNQSSKCTMYSFAMIVQDLCQSEGITDITAIDKAIRSAAYDKQAGYTHVVDFDIYSHALTSQEFGMLAQAEVEYLQLRGAKLGTIAKIAQGIKLRRPGSKVHCTMPIQSDVSPAFWHQVVLTGDDSGRVYAHNPGGSHAQPNQAIERAEFYRRWSVCMNIAHIFISNLVRADRLGQG